MKEIIFTAAASVLIIFINGVLQGFMSAFARANYLEIEEQAKEDNPVAVRLDKMHENEADLVQGVNVLSLVLNGILGVFLITVVWKYMHFSVAGKCLMLFVLEALAAVFGIVVPAKAVSYHPDKWVYALFKGARIILAVFSPLTWTASKLSDIVILTLGKNPHEETDNVTEDEIITIVNEGQEQGVIEDSEAQMITKIIEFGDKQASDIMVHRTNMNAFDGSMAVAQVYESILEGSNSRYPVYENDINNIIGILHLKDFIRAYSDTQNHDKQICEVEDLLYAPEFIPETRNINDLFKMMQTDKIHMAIVVDEYGQTSGLVTMEDIIEEIMGNIQDEHDEEEEMIKRSEDNTYIVDGMSLLEDLEEELSIRFESEYNTINGFLTSRLGKIPSAENVGFTVEYRDYIFKALEVGNRVFESICITKKQEDEYFASTGTNYI